MREDAVYEILTFVTAQMSLENIMLSEIKLAQKATAVWPYLNVSLTELSLGNT